MRIKGTKSIRSVYKSIWALIGHYINDPAHSIGTKFDRNYPFINFYTISNGYRYIIELKCISKTFHRHTVHKKFNSASCKSIQRNWGPRTQSARTSYLDSWSLLQRIWKIGRSIGHGLSIYSHNIISWFSDLLNNWFPFYLYFIKLHLTIWGQFVIYV